MNITKISGTLGVAAFAALAVPLAQAQDAAGWYVGANAGQSRSKIDDPRIDSSLLANGFSDISISDDNRDTGYKLFGGYQFNRNFSLEGGYFDLGRFGYTAAMTPPGTLDGNISLKGLNLDAVLLLPLTERLSGFGRVGMNYAQARDTFTGTGLVDVSNPDPDKRSLGYKFGAGLQYSFTETLAMRVEAERYRIDDAIGNKGDIDLLSVGLIYRFGEKSPQPARVEPTPAPPPAIVAVAPPPPPVPVPAATPSVPPVLAKVNVSVDSLFDFGKSDVKPEGKAVLDKFANDLKGATIHTIAVTGHADRIGPQAYNMALSTHRAAAVKAYLVNSAGMPSDSIIATGVDGADPVTKPGQCRGEKATRKLIACLQPDRRVEIEVTGTR